MAQRRKVGKNRHYRTDREIDEANKRAFKQAAWEQRACAVCGDTRERDEDGRPAWEAHHVIEKGFLKTIFMLDRIWDIRNALRLCVDCHLRHTRGNQRVNLDRLTDDNYEFAWDALGMASADRLRRMYNGRDPRWTALQERCNEALAASREMLDEAS